MSAWVVVSPLSDGIEHLFLNLDMFIPNGRVVESPQNVIDDFIDGHAGVLPGI